MERPAARLGVKRHSAEFIGKLDGKKVAILTGRASGLDRQEALRFADERAEVAICDIQEERLDETRRLCEERAPPAVQAVREGGPQQRVSSPWESLPRRCTSGRVPGPPRRQSLGSRSNGQCPRSRLDRGVATPPEGARERLRRRGGAAARVAPHRPRPAI